MLARRPVDIPCANDGDCLAGRAQLAFRPERSQLVEPDEPHHLRGVIEAVLYLGTATLYQCRLANDVQVTLRESNEGALGAQRSSTRPRSSARGRSS